ncbi:MAG TPA: ABC transporter ATP-binding protein [Albitalea sp.]|nr:ABC transporter ATP-binding protein [Albitalea sp.]
MIELSSLVKRYGEVEAVAGVDLSVRAGELFGLIGHNGAGKSTLFKMMLGLVPPTSGDIRIDGQPVRGEAFRRVRRHVGYLPENVVLYDNLTGLETLGFFADLKGVDRSECAPLLDKLGLAHAAARRVRGYSKGMRQRLGFAQALLGQPKLLFLDEPTNGLDPEGIREFYRILGELKDRGVTIVLTSHILSEIQERVGRLAIMKNGRIHAVGSVQSLRETMALPLWFDLRLSHGAEAGLRRAVDATHGAEISIVGEHVSVRCPRHAKMPLLQALAALGPDVADLHVREPSLEDVLLGQPG